MKTIHNGLTNFCKHTRFTFASPILWLLLLFATDGNAAQFEDFTYEINQSTVTISEYTGVSGIVTIPETIEGVPVTSLADEVFEDCYWLRSISLPNSVTSIGSSTFQYRYWLTNITLGISLTSIGERAFGSCTRLTHITLGNSLTSIEPSMFEACTGLRNITLPNGVTNIGFIAFASCTGLTNITLPNSLINISSDAFSGCTSLTGVTIPDSVSNIETMAFSYCTNLTEIYFDGNAPNLGGGVFADDAKATVYYLRGTTGWGSTFGGRPTAVWNPPAQTSITRIGVRTNQFGFTLTGSGELLVVVEACTNLTNPAWSPLQTNTLSGDSFYFSDPRWTNYPTRFYRLRSP